MSTGETRPPRAGAAAAFRAYPVTLLCTVTAVVLFAVAWGFDRRHPRDRFGGKGRYGALTTLHYPAMPELRGVFQLWGDHWSDGDWWRLLTTGFHHGDLLHLLLNLAGVVYLGRLLEPRLGSAKFLLLFLTAIVVANIPHAMMSEGAVGLSGGLYALFGALLSLRRTDEEVSRMLPDATVLLMLLWIPVGMLLTATDVVNIGNAAHLTGLIYGWIAGRALFTVRTQRGWFTPRMFVAAHALLIPVAFLTVRPVWNARYHWYRAVQADEPSERVALLEVAVARNPRLAGAWRLLAETHFKRDSGEQKWRAALQGVKWCPADKKLLEFVSLHWQHASSDDRDLALRTLRELFPRTDREMRERLGLFAPPTVPPYRSWTVGLPWVHRTVPVPGGPDLFWPPVDGRRVATPEPLHAPAVDPHRPDSAALGRLL